MTLALAAFGFIGTYTILLGGLLWKAAKFLSSALKTGAKKTWKWIKGKQRRAPSKSSISSKPHNQPLNPHCHLFADPPACPANKMPLPEKLFDDISKHMSQYIETSRDQNTILTLWVAHGHSLPNFQITPRLYLTSMEKGCGKTTALDVISGLVPRGIRCENTSSPVLFRLVDEHQPTLCLDELDTYLFKNPELVGLLNAGHRRGAKALRVRGETVMGFDAFAPVVLAGIGKIPDPLMDRSLVVSLKRAPTDSKIKRFCVTQTKREADQLHSMLQTWASTSYRQLKNIEPALPDTAVNRCADNWWPLFAIAKAVGGSWPDRVLQAYQAVQVNCEPGDDAKG